MVWIPQVNPHYAFPIHNMGVSTPLTTALQWHLAGVTLQSVIQFSNKILFKKEVSHFGNNRLPRVLTVQLIRVFWNKNMRFCTNIKLLPTSVQDTENTRLNFYHSCPCDCSVYTIGTGQPCLTKCRCYSWEMSPPPPHSSPKDVMIMWGGGRWRMWTWGG